MSGRLFRTLTVFIVIGALAICAHARQALAQSETGILAIGDAVVSGFSGVVEPDPQDPPLTSEQQMDETFINPDGISARINYLAGPGFVWDARVWPADRTLEFLARDVGQVFGVAMDDAKKPNIYLAASSAYGLHIVKPDEDGDGRPERLKQGYKQAQWMEGLWGKADAKDGGESNGGPGSIWKVDGETGEITLFANVELEGAPNTGAALGNIIYVGEQKSLFVSDLSTGCIHRYYLKGEETGLFDHGVTGRESAGLDAVTHDPRARLDITSSDFDSEDPETFGMTDPDRRVHGLAYNDGRLYYAVAGGSQIWSVGFEEKTGEFLTEARWEIDVPEKPKALPVTDMKFTRKGALILAQRGEPTSLYDYSGLAAHGKARTYRYWLEEPDNPETKSRWIEAPEEYAVGFDTNNRQTSGGLALGQGYTQEGYIDTSVCEASLWTTGDDLRRTKVDELVKGLTPGGPLPMDGLQSMPTGPVKQYEPGKNNTPPWASYMLDNDPDNTELLDVSGEPSRWADASVEGWMGDVEVLRGCDSAIASGVGGGGYYGWPTDYPYWTNYTGGGGGGGGGGGSCIIGTPGCTPPPPVTCAKPEGKFSCDPATGTWTFNGTISGVTPANADTTKITGMYPGHLVPGAPMMSYANPGLNFQITGGVSRQTMGADFCFFNKAEMESGKPFAYCKTSVDEPAPSETCVKKK